MYVWFLCCFCVCMLNEVWHDFVATIKLSESGSKMLLTHTQSRSRALNASICLILTHLRGMMVCSGKMSKKFASQSFGLIKRKSTNFICICKFQKRKKSRRRERKWEINFNQIVMLGLVRPTFQFSCTCMRQMQSNGTRFLITVSRMSSGTSVELT